MNKVVKLGGLLFVILFMLGLGNINVKAISITTSSETLAGILPLKK